MKSQGFLAVLALLLTLAALRASSAVDAAPPAQPGPPGGDEKPPSSGPIVIRSEKNDVSPPLRQIPPKPDDGLPKEAPLHRVPEPAKAGPRAPVVGSDPVLQTAAPTGAMPASSASFDGIGATGYVPPDTNGDIGPNHYVQAVNVSFAVYSRAGSLVLGPLTINTVWTGFGGLCETTNRGDPIVLYDGLADRWFISQFAFSGSAGPYYQCIAVSQTGDPTGSWYRYSFFWSNSKLNDYPKFGVWPDGYYGHVNQFCGASFCGSGVMAFDRERMLRGLSATAITFDLAASNPLDWGMLPSHLTGPPPPAGAPNYYASYKTNTAMQVFEFDVDWANPVNSTFGAGASHAPNATVAVAAFDTSFACGVTGRACIPQPDSAPKLDVISDLLMYRLNYRNFGSHESLVVNNTVDANGADRAGIRWWELRRSGGGWSLQQEGTYSPDTDHRWMGSIAMDAAGNIALGYSVSSSTTYPSIRYAGRLAGDPAGQLSQGETTLVAGAGSQTSTSNRWGDYSSMSVDPADGCTFWYTTEYYATTSAAGWKTRIGAFKFPSCVAPSNPAPTLASLSPSSAVAGAAPVNLTLNGSDFVYNSVVRVNGADRLTTYVSSGQLTLTLTAADLASAGPLNVTVFNPAPGGGTSGTATFTVNAPGPNPVPAITGLSPSTAMAGQPGLDLRITGTNFVAGSVVRWNGADRTTTVLSATQLVASIGQADIAASGVALVSVFTPGPGGGPSNDFPFGVAVSNDNIANARWLSETAFALSQSTVGFTTEGTDPVPRDPTSNPPNQICGSTSVPTQKQSASAWYQLTPVTSGTLALDTQFSSYDTVLGVYTGSPGSLTSIACNDDAVLDGTLWSSLSVDLTGGTHYYVEAMAYGNDPGGDLLLNGTYSGTLQNPAPMATILNPDTAPAGGPAFTLTVTGTNFVANSVVRVNGADRPTAFVSSTQVAAIIPASDIAAPGSATITVFSPAPGGGLSGGLTLTIEPQSKLGFTQQPSGGVENVAFATQPWVAVQDVDGNTVTTDSTTQVTLSLQGPGTTGLSCTGGLTKTVSSGVAQFSGCKVSVPNNGYSLHAVSNTGLTPADSATFNVTPAPTKLGFTQQPSHGVTGVPLATQPWVAVQDSSGNTVTTDNATWITITLSGLACSSTTTVQVVNGVAKFTACAVTGTGSFTLHATSNPALTAADSASFTITGPATKLAFTQQPSNGITGTPLATQPVVAVQDASGATVLADSTTQVTIALTGPAATLACTNPGNLTVTVSAGLATFAGCSVSAPGTGYGLDATSNPVLTAANSASFTVTGPAAKLAFVQQPPDAGTGFQFTVALAIQDAGGQIVTVDNTTQVTLTLTGGGALTCAGGLIGTALSGIATFQGCSVDTAGSHTIHAASGSLTPTDSVAFNALATAGVHWYFAEGFTGLGWNTTVHLLNTSPSTTANVQVNYLLDSGSPVLRNVTVPPLRDVVLDASNVAEGPGTDVAFGLRIVSDIPIVAEEQMYAGASGDWAHGTTGSQVLSNNWYFAEGFTQFGWETFVLVANPGAVAANVTITYQVQGGSAVTNNMTVGAGKRGTFLGHVDVPNQAFSVSLASDQPIVSEMAMYDPARAISHRTVGVTQPASEWYLGEGFTGFGWETFISVGNPGSVDATVTAVYGIDGGSPVTKQIIVPAHSRGTFIARDSASGPGADVAFGIHVTSTQPVVVQEVLIDPAAGASRANSTMASAALNAKWSFSGGSSQTGVVSFYTVSNPGGTAVSVTATYYFDDGTSPVSQVLNIPASSRGTFATVGGTPAVPAGHRLGVIIVSSGGPVVAQEAVYDEANVRAYSAGGAPGP